MEVLEAIGLLILGVADFIFAMYWFISHVVDDCTHDKKGSRKSPPKQCTPSPRVQHLEPSVPPSSSSEEPHSSVSSESERAHGQYEYADGYGEGYKSGYDAGYDDASKIIAKDTYDSGYQSGISDCQKRARKFVSCFEQSPAFLAVRDYDFSANPRLYSAVCGSVRYISPFSISVKTSSDGESVYETTLFSCTCQDYRFRKLPCKHMLRLATDFGLLSTLDDFKQRSALSAMQQQFSNLRKQQEKATRSIQRLAALQQDLTRAPVSGESTVSVPCNAALPMFTAKKDRRLCKFLSDYEYESMQPAARYQLALNLYLEQKKTHPEIGRAFERYIGYLCEQQQYSVIYNGALEKKHDQGRDLIAISPDRKSIYVIQCKYYAADKTVHENAVMQLFGSVAMLSSVYSGISIHGALVSSCPLSPDAKNCLHQLASIRCYENVHTDLRRYPIIKCAVSSSGEKYFYLPFDPCYDSVVANQYVVSVSDAMQKGFVRALKKP